jgi:hypothetical protein
VEITIQMLEAKRDEYAAGVRQHEALMQANAGALQVTEELLAVARAPQPENKTKEKR